MMGKRELVALLSLSSWCLVTVVWFFHAVPWVSLQFVIVVFPDHTNLQFSELIVKYNVGLKTLLQQGILSLYSTVFGYIKSNEWLESLLF